MTERLYYADPYQTTFQARVVERLTVAGNPAVVLNRTCFYPESGGQPGDQGSLNGIRVLNTLEREEDKAVLHVLTSPLPDEAVTGHVDWKRRFDHMQQHTGQHILSQAFQRILGAETVGFHLGAEVTTIDLAIEGLSSEQASQVEEEANQVIYEDRPVICRFVSQEELPSLPLRKPPKVTGIIRIVEVENYDWSPCGGTHVRRTGEVGIIVLRKWERRGNTIRLDFLCGRRALADYRWKNAAVNRLAAGLSIKDRELVETVERLLAEAGETRRQLGLAKERLLDYEAAELLAATPGPPHVVRQSWRDRPVEEVRRLAQRVTERPGAVALFGVVTGDKANLIFARSNDQSIDMSAVLKTVIPLIGGKGGGTPSLAQGGGSEISGLEEALARAQTMVG